VRDDRFTVFTNEPIALTPAMIDNDSTTTGNLLGAITVLTQPTNGTLTESNGTLTYTPNANFNGVDSFVYTVADSVDPTVGPPRGHRLHHHRLRQHRTRNLHPRHCTYPLS
jgi:hypothetical protein